MDQRETKRRAPVALIAAAVLGVLIAIGAALGGPLRFSGPRWVPGAAPSPAPIRQIRPTQNIATPTPQPPITAGHVPDLTWLVILIASLVVAIGAFLLIRWLLRRRRDPSEAVAGELQAAALLEVGPDDPSVETSMAYLRRGLARALDVLDGSRLPADAIIEAWLGLQEAAEDAGFQRQSAETPTEFTTRILRQVDVDPVALSTLRRLYLGVRFGDHVATTDDVAEARGALLTLEAQWAATR